MSSSSPTTSTPEQIVLPDPSNLSTCTGPEVQAPSTCYDPTDLVKIKVRAGSVEKDYVVPRGLLVFHSSYFAAALDPSNMEAFVVPTGGEVAIDESIKAFDAFCCWLYTGRLADPARSTTSLEINELYLPPRILCKIWVLADTRGVPALKNAAIDMLHERMCADWTLNMGSVLYSYENTVRGSELRKFSVDACTQTRSYGGFQALMAEYDPPADFLAEAIPVLVRQGESHVSIGRRAWTALDRCQWHDHSGPGGKLRLASRD